MDVLPKYRFRYGYINIEWISLVSACSNSSLPSNVNQLEYIVIPSNAVTVSYDVYVKSSPQDGYVSRWHLTVKTNKLFGMKSGH